MFSIVYKSDIIYYNFRTNVAAERTHHLQLVNCLMSDLMLQCSILTTALKEIREITERDVEGCGGGEDEEGERGKGDTGNVGEDQGGGPERNI